LKLVLLEVAFALLLPEAEALVVALKVLEGVFTVPNAD